MKRTILIVDDEPDIVSVLRGFLKDKYNILTANDGAKALEIINNESVDLMLLDLDLPDMNGTDIIVKTKECFPEIAILVVSGTGDIRAAVKAMQLGAYNYIEKPPDYDEVRTVVKKILKDNEMRNEVDFFRSEVREETTKFNKIIGKSKKINEILDTVQKSAMTWANVLITGESGTGKELIAHAIHDSSARKDKPFVVVSCPNLPTELVESELFGHEKGAFTGASEKRVGKFEFANGGTIFLDEIGELKQSVQARLLRVIQEKEFNLLGGYKIIKVDVRIIAATNRKLENEIRNGNFREDLFFRLNVIPVTLPPLRQRKEDIPLLATHIIESFQRELHCKADRFSSKAIEILQCYDWPGNIRELKNVVERVLSLHGTSKTILPKHLPAELTRKDDFIDFQSVKLAKNKSLENIISSMEMDLINQALEQSNGILTKAARLLDVEPWKLRYKIKKIKT